MKKCSTKKYLLSPNDSVKGDFRFYTTWAINLSASAKCAEDKSEAVKLIERDFCPFRSFVYSVALQFLSDLLIFIRFFTMIIFFASGRCNLLVNFAHFGCNLVHVWYGFAKSFTKIHHQIPFFHKFNSFSFIQFRQ
jgi:hypothetical protein